MNEVSRYSKGSMDALERRVARVLERRAVPLWAQGSLANQIASDLLCSNGITWDEALRSPEVSREIDRRVDRVLAEAGIGQLTLNFDVVLQRRVVDRTVSEAFVPEAQQGGSSGAEGIWSTHRSGLKVAESVFSVIELCVPPRISSEEIGDALEVLESLAAAGAPSWKLHLKIASTVFWLGLNVVREVVTAALGRKPA